MAVNTAKVTGRRSLHFETIEQILQEAERLGAAPAVRPLGNWSLGQILQHLAVSLHNSIDGVDVPAPRLVRLIGPLLKRRMLTRPMPAGFRMPKYMKPAFMPSPHVTTDEGLAALREAVARYQSESKRAPHVAFGTLTPQQYDQLHCRHAELHLSFIVPESTSSRPEASSQVIAG